MRILQLHNSYLEPGGEDGVVARERALLERRGHEVVHLDFENPTKRKEQVSGLVQATWNRQSAQRVRQAMADRSFDVAHVHNTWYRASASAVVEASRHASVVATLHNYRRVCLNSYLFRDNQICTDCVGTIPWRGVQRGCYRESRSASVAIGVSTVANRIMGTADRAVDRYLVLSDFAAKLTAGSGIPPDKIVRHDNFVPDPGERLIDAVQSSAVLALGRLSPEKGFLELLQQWKRASPPGLRLLVVGDGPLREQVDAFTGPGIEVLGRLSASEVSEQMRLCRALLFPSRWFEGQPLVILEALAAGLPVLSSDHPPLREIIQGHQQHLVRNDRWDEAFALLGDDSWVEKASSSSRQLFEERFCETIAAERLEGIYRSVLASR